MNDVRIGQSVPRAEDRRFLVGQGRYVDDITVSGMCHAVTIMSPYAHASIVRIDTSAALQAPGVVCVLTGQDVRNDGLGGIGPVFMPEDLGLPKGYRTSRPILVADRVRCMGDRVALVVAETLSQARDAAELVEIEYEGLPALVDIEDSLNEGAADLWADCPGNIAFSLEFGSEQATNQAFEQADHIVKISLTNNRISANPIEPRTVIGEYRPADGTYTLHTTSQNPHGLRGLLANDVFKISDSKIHIISPDVGGGFGVKIPCYPEDALALWAAKRCGRPVKWVATRSDSLLGDNHARNQIVDGELALDKSGKFLAVRARAKHALGAYTLGSTLTPMMFSLKFIPNVYDIKAVHVVSSGVFTNTSPLTSYRGAGRPEAAYLIERLIEVAAKELGLDAIELRRKNFIPSKSMPYTTATGVCYDSGEFEESMKLCLERADWDGFESRRRDSERHNKLRGRGLACFIEHAGVFNDRIDLHVNPSGSLTIVAGTHSHGQGHATTYAQMVAEWLSVPFESIDLIQGDTRQVLQGRGTYAARSSMVGGCALKFATDDVTCKATKMAAFLMDCPTNQVDFSDGAFKKRGSNQAMPFIDVAKAFYLRSGIPKEMGFGLSGTGFYHSDPANFPNGCHACEVEIDPETGGVELVRYTAVDDTGEVINPMICQGQLHGGIAQGVGQALMEHVIYAADSGQLLSGSFMDYAMPRASHFPHLNLAFRGVACTTNPLGIKGVGEAGTIGAPPALIIAILHALARHGIEHVSMPATSSVIWESLQTAHSDKLQTPSA